MTTRMKDPSAAVTQNEVNNRIEQEARAVALVHMPKGLKMTKVRMESVQYDSATQRTLRFVVEAIDGTKVAHKVALLRQVQAEMTEESLDAFVADTAKRLRAALPPMKTWLKFVHVKLDEVTEEQALEFTKDQKTLTGLQLALSQLMAELDPYQVAVANKYWKSLSPTRTAAEAVKPESRFHRVNGYYALKN